MSHRQHSIGTYKDGYQEIAFCTICSAEGEQLLVECVGIEENKLEKEIKNLWSDVDKYKLNR